MFFTAHSLPLRVVAEGDPYPDQVAESAADIAALLDLDAQPGLAWSVAWQSAGRTADPWIGPDLLDEIRRVAASRRHRRGGVPGGLRLRPSRGPLRPRHRGGPGGRVGRGAPSSGRRRSTTTPAFSASWPTWCAGPPPPTPSRPGEQRGRRDAIPALGGRGGRRHRRPGRRLGTGHADPRDPVPDVVVFEADDRLGGKLRSETFGDRRVDVAADAFLARRPEATDLCEAWVSPTSSSRSGPRARRSGPGVGSGPCPTASTSGYRPGGGPSSGRASSVRPSRRGSSRTWSCPTSAPVRPSATGPVGEIVGNRLGRPVVDAAGGPAHRRDQRRRTSTT